MFSGNQPTSLDVYKNMAEEEQLLAIKEMGKLLSLASIRVDVE